MYKEQLARYMAQGITQSQAVYLMRKYLKAEDRHTRTEMLDNHTEHNELRALNYEARQDLEAFENWTTRL